MLRLQPDSHGQQASLRICLSGRVSESHLTYLDELIESGKNSGMRIFLDLEQVATIDLQAVRYLARGEGDKFEFISCPKVIRRWLQYEKPRAAQRAG